MVRIASRFPLVACLLLVLPGVAADSFRVQAGGLPSVRSETSAVWDGTSAWVFGGYPPKDQIVRYDPLADETWTAASRLPTARWGTSAVWAGGFAWILGGLENGGRGTLDEVLRFDPVRDQLMVAGHLAHPVEFSSAVTDGDRAYVFGSRWLHGDEVVAYEFATGASWVAGRLPSARSGTSAVWDGAYAYVFGGDAAGGYRADILRFDPRTGATDRLPSALPSGRSLTAAFWDGENAYIAGGYFFNDDPTDTDPDAYTEKVVRFHPQTGEVATMRARMPQPRAGQSAVWTGRAGLLFGGIGCCDGAHYEVKEILRYTLEPAAVQALAATPGLDEVALRWLAPPPTSYSGALVGYLLWRCDIWEGVFCSYLGFTDRTEFIDHMEGPGMADYVVVPLGAHGRGAATRVYGVSLGVPDVE